MKFLLKRLNQSFVILSLTIMLAAGCSHIRNNVSVADKLQIKNVIALYASYADKKQTEDQAKLFIKNAVIEVYQGQDEKPIKVIRGRNELQKSFKENLDKFDKTMHFNGQNLVMIEGDTATGEALCIAHHIVSKGNKKNLIVMGIRYSDEFVRQNNKWLFSKRKLYLDWVENKIVD